MKKYWNRLKEFFEHNVVAYNIAREIIEGILTLVIGAIIIGIFIWIIVRIWG